jgi:hypothetical protein
MFAMGEPAAFAVTISVPAESCVYFAGRTQPDLEAVYPPSPGWEDVLWEVGVSGSDHCWNLHNDAAPWEGVIRAYNDPAYSDVTARTASSLIPPFIDITSWESAGIKLSITATGSWGHHVALHSGPDGYESNYETHEEYDDLGISRVYAPLNSLVGVFLGDDSPDPAAMPASLTIGIDDMTTPVLQQTFVIGSILENITIPSGATRLFLGLNDAAEWWNNDGDMNVTVTPEPATLLLLGLGSLVLRRRW